MRRILVWLLLFAIAAAVPVLPSRQPAVMAAPEETAIQTPATAALHIVPLEVTPLPERPQAINTAVDECVNAPDIAQNLINNGFGDTTSVDLVSTAPSFSDPVLTCIWGSPGSSQGYRTVWYRFRAPENGRVIVSTANNFNPNRYDTVVAVYTGSCGALNMLACNDDFDGLASRVSFPVAQDTTYYIEVADWNEAKPGPLELDFFLVLEPTQSLWETVSVTGFPPDRTRHATAVLGPDIYLVGGQDDPGPGDTPSLSGDLYRIETDTGKWVQLNTKPGDPLHHLTAAIVDGKLYVPGGSNSIDGDQFVSDHERYDIVTGTWAVGEGVKPEPLPYPLGWAQAVSGPTSNGYYLTGGISAGQPFSTTAVVHDEVWFYRLFEPDWISLPAMGTARYAHTAVWVNDGLCVIGGIDDSNSLLPNGECYQPGGSGVWQSIPPLNIARYGAASAVTADGRWVVFGGTTVNNSSQHVAVPEVEVFDFDAFNPQWEILPVEYNLGGTTAVRERAWPQGEFVGSYLYALGGNDTTDYFVTTLVQRLFIPSATLNLPQVWNGKAQEIFDNNFTAAHILPLNTPVRDQFGDSQDFFEAYRFTVNTPGNYTVLLSDIPSGSNYDLTIYDSNKTFLNEGVNGGTTREAVAVNLAPGQYYILVERIFGQADGSRYQIEVRQ